MDQDLFKQQFLESHRDEFQALLEARQAATTGPSGAAQTRHRDSEHTESAAPPTEESVGSLSEGRLTTSFRKAYNINNLLFSAY